MVNNIPRAYSNSPNITFDVLIKNSFTIYSP